MRALPARAMHAGLHEDNTPARTHPPRTRPPEWKYDWEINALVVPLRGLKHQPPMAPMV